jgi:hypothetical protein
MYTLCSGIDNSHYEDEIQVFNFYRDAVSAYDSCKSNVKVIFKLKHDRNGDLVSRECKKFKSAQGSCNAMFLEMVKLKSL